MDRFCQNQVLQPSQKIQSSTTESQSSLNGHHAFNIAKKHIDKARALNLTRSPVQNIGHSCHGGFLASPSHVLKYGPRTTNGRTGGVSLDASEAGRLSSAEPAAATTVSQRIVTLLSVLETCQNINNANNLRSRDFE